MENTIGLPQAKSTSEGKTIPMVSPNQSCDPSPLNYTIPYPPINGGLFFRAERTPGVAAVSGGAGAGAGAKSPAPSQTNSAPSLVEKGITQQNLDSFTIHQALPGFVDGQFTLSGLCLFPAPPTPQAQTTEPDPLPPNQLPLPWNGHQLPFCPDSGWLSGTCEHGTTRWIHLSCKRRSCPICGEQRRLRIAWRISRGIELLAGSEGAAWFVGTFNKDISKKKAVQVQNKFIRWLRSNVDISLQYAATWETTRIGRLHLNLILAPWKYTPQSILSDKWRDFGGGRVVWIQRVLPSIGFEAAKANQPIGNYVSKWEQMVMTGRGANYSKNWPKLPDKPLSPRQGSIKWWFYSALSEEARLHWYEREMGTWYLVSPEEYASVFGEPCSCFSRGMTSQSSSIQKGGET